jgi:hypothetical protein
MGLARHAEGRGAGDVLGFACVLFVVYLVYRLFIYGRYVSPLRHLPGPKVRALPLNPIHDSRRVPAIEYNANARRAPDLAPQNHNPLLGQALTQYGVPNPNAAATAWARQWPGAPLLRVPGPLGAELVLANTHAAQKEILQGKTYAFAKPAWLLRALSGTIGLGMLFAEGEEHVQQRRAFAPMFSAAHLHGLVPVVREKTLKWCDVLERVAGLEGGEIEGGCCGMLGL